MEEKVQEMWR